MAKGVESNKELPTDRLATTDETGKRLYIFPADVRGFFRKYRTLVHGILMLIFLVLPWVKINGQQALLLDVSRRRFSVFGLSFWGHDAPMIFFVLSIFVFSLLFVTAVWGRIWCGWACPQTVFIDFVFRRIERLLEGDAVKRRQLAQAPWSIDKLAKRSLKWGIFGVASLVVSHSFLAYFVGVERLAEMIQSPPAQNVGTFLFMAFITAVLLFDFGWFREQFCIIMCPYGRLQSVLMDNSSQVIEYQVSRGEPRRGTAPKGQEGDCVNCFRCVQVCPTGIDIRRGTQMECIACTACIDACDEVMTKVKKPQGLITYSKFSGVSIRAKVYFGILIVLITSLVLVLSQRSKIEVTVLRANDSPYTVLANGNVLNHFKLHLTNQSFEDSQIELRSADTSTKVVTALKSIQLPQGTSLNVDVFTETQAEAFVSGRHKSRLEMVDSRNGTVIKESEVNLVGPFR